VSPARARTSLDEVVAAGRDLLEAGGPEAVTMLAVAERVGVKAPSLYKRLASRDALLAAIAKATAEDLGRTLEPLTRDPDAAAALRAVAHAFRAFAHAHPRATDLLFADLPSEARTTAASNVLVSEPLIQLAGRVAGPAHALEAARLVTAFARGFVSMELAGAFRLGGDVDEAYRYGIDVLVDALSSRGGGGARRPRARPVSGAA
jgi:AcrR family transcriptional regulator